VGAPLRGGSPYLFSSLLALWIMDTSHETWFERLMQEATEAGEFDDLPGAGKPIDDLSRAYDPAWWAKAWIAREAVTEAAGELSWRVRRDLPKILAGTDESVMAESLRELNQEIESVNARLAEPDHLPFLDIAQLIAGRSSRQRDS